MVPPPRSQENWFGLSNSCAMSTWMVWTPAARQDLPAKGQFTSRVPRAGSPRPRAERAFPRDLLALEAARPDLLDGREAAAVARRAGLPGRLRRAVQGEPGAADAGSLHARAAGRVRERRARAGPRRQRRADH